MTSSTYNYPIKTICTSKAVGLLLLLAVVLAISSGAADRTWDGEGVDNNWSTDMNWAVDTAPATNDALVFAGTNRTDAVNDFPADTRFNGLYFPNVSTGQSFTLSGNAMALGGAVSNNAASELMADTIALELQVSGTNVIFEVNEGHGLVVSGVISENISGRGISKIGAGDLSLSGVNTYTGPTTINAGWLSLGDGGTSGSLSTTSVILANGVFMVNRDDTVTQGIDFSGAPITGSGHLVQVRTNGTLVLNAANTFSGGARFGRLDAAWGVTQSTEDGGTIEILHSSALGTGQVVFERGGTLVLSTNGLAVSNRVFVSNWSGLPNRVRLDQSGSATGTMAGNIQIHDETGNGFQVDVGANDLLTMNGTFFRTGGGGAGITKTGSGTLMLTGDSAGLPGTQSLVGDIDIWAGWLQLGDGVTNGTTAPGERISIEADAHVLINRSDTVIQGIHFSRFPISGAGHVMKIGTNTLVLNAANSYSGGTSIGRQSTGTGGGTIELLHSRGLGTGGVNFEQSGTLILATNGLDVPTPMYWYNWGGGDRRLVLDLPGTNSGALSGTFVMRNSSQRCDIEVGVDDTLTLSGTLTDWSNIGESWDKEGEGTLVLSGTTEHYGWIDVNAGTLQFDGNLTAGRAVVRVHDGATLGGSGNIATHVTLNNGGRLASGLAGAGTLSLGGLTFNEGATMDIGMHADGPIGMIAVTGGTFNVASPPGVIVTLTGTNVPAGGRFTLMDWTGATANSAASSGFSLAPPHDSTFLLRVVDQTLVLQDRGLLLILR